MRTSPRTPIIKVVGDACNLRCEYCFYSGLEQQTIKVMSSDLLRDFTEQYLSAFCGSLRFVWHGGEPLLAGIAFFEKALEFQRRYAKPGDIIENLIQTNGTLITDAWASFFKDNHFRVGVSLDGDRVSHNKFRKDCSGRGSFDRVVNGIGILKDYGIIPGIIQTLTKDNLGRLSEAFDFFVSIGIRGWAVNFFDSTSCLNPEMKSQGLTDVDVVAAYGLIVGWWLHENRRDISIREIENVMAGVVGRRAKNCSFNGTCANYFCLDNDGAIYPCDRLSGDASLSFGDLTTTSLEGVLFGQAASTHAEKSYQLSSDCVGCRWRLMCNNGCTAMRNQDSGKYSFCESRLHAFDLISGLF